MARIKKYDNLEDAVVDDVSEVSNSARVSGISNWHASVLTLESSRFEVRRPTNTELTYQHAPIQFIVRSPG